MLSTQLNHMAEENILAPNCICNLKRHVTNILKDGRYTHFLHISFFFFFKRSRLNGSKQALKTLKYE